VISGAYRELAKLHPKKRETIWQLLKANLSKKMRRMKPLRHKSKRFKEVVSPSFFVTLK
jgi:hypothetical protein